MPTSSKASQLGELERDLLVARQLPPAHTTLEFLLAAVRPDLRRSGGGRVTSPDLRAELPRTEVGRPCRSLIR